MGLENFGGSGGGGGGVTSLNGETGALNLVAGTNITITPSGTNITIASSGGGTVSSVSNSDGSLTISPTTGAVVASLNPAHANIWTAQQTFENAPVLSFGQVGPNISVGQSLSGAYAYSNFGYVLNDNQSNGFFGNWSQGTNFTNFGAFNAAGELYSRLAFGRPADGTVSISTLNGNASIISGGTGAGVTSGSYIRVTTNTLQGVESGDGLGANINVANGTIAFNTYGTGGTYVSGTNQLVVVYDNSNRMGLGAPAFQITTDDANGYGDYVETLNNVLDDGAGNMTVAGTISANMIAANVVGGISINITGSGIVHGRFTVGNKTNLAASTGAFASLNFPLGTATPTAPIAGDEWYDFAQLCLMTVLDGIKQALMGVIFTSTANSGPSNTGTETSLVGTTGIGTSTLPANFFVIGKTVRITGGGVYTTPVSPGNLVIKVKYGATILATGTISNLATSATNDGFRYSVFITCRTTGATGTVMTAGDFTYDLTAVTTKGGINLNNSGATQTINTTSSNVIDVTATWSTSTTSTITGTVASIEVLN